MNDRLSILKKMFINDISVAIQVSYSPPDRDRLYNDTIQLGKDYEDVIREIIISDIEKCVGKQPEFYLKDIKDKANII